MADEGQTEQSRGETAWAIRRVPGNLLGFLASRIAEYVERAEDISAEIHECPGQPAKLVLYGAEGPAKDLLEQTRDATDSIQKDSSTTHKILVKNFPPAVDKVMLEAFFEARKTGGGGPVKNVQLNREKNWAVVEFDGSDVVERLMSKVPIKMMATELDIRPFTPLLQGGGSIENLEIHNLPKELTDDLLAMHIEGTIETTEISSAEYMSDDGQELVDCDLSLRQLTNTCSMTEGFVRETVTCLQPVQLRMLQLTNYTETVLEQLPEIKVVMDLEKIEISFEGDAKTVLSGYRNLMETLCKFRLNIINNKPEEHIELYKREKVIEYINDKLEAQNIVCTWEVNEQMILICSLQENIATCTKLIDESVREIKFPISKESSATLITQEWEKEVKLIQAEKEIVYKVFSDKTSTNVTVVANVKEVSRIVGRIKTFLANQLDRESETFNGPEQISSSFKQLYDLNSTLAHTLIDRITEGLSRLYHVTVKKEYIQGSRYNGWVDHHRYTINGTRDGRTHMKKQIAELNILYG